jgi:Nitrile hydratase, alpha chain
MRLPIQVARECPKHYYPPSASRKNDETDMAIDAPAAAPMTRRDIEAKIVALAWQDNDFRRKFVADPKGQFEERLGVTLPPSLTMTVHEEEESSLHFVIPMKPQANLDQLSDEDLEKVAGGTDLAVTVAIVSAVWLVASTIVSGTTSNWGKG